MGNNPGSTNQSSTVNQVNQEGTKLNPGDQGQPGTPGMAENVCRECSGTGKLGATECPNCGGTGKVMEEMGGA
jgi:DnaJ-class molecular chaperone